MLTAIREIALRYGDLLAARWPLPAALLLVGAVLFAAWLAQARRADAGLGRATTVAIILGAIGAGLVLAWRQASLVDDAFISFRYAENLARGRGLVWNVGERVEGYTNFLWTVLLALGVRLTPWRAPSLALVLAPACFVANLLVVARIGRVLGKDTPGVPRLPLAAVLLAVQATFTSFATTGMETMAASLLTDLGVLALVDRDGARGAFLAGLSFVLGTLTRPDHVLFAAIAAVVFLDRFARPMAAARGAGPRRMWAAGGRAIAAFAAPFLLLAAHLGWRLAYYGSLVPNTYYAKSAGEANWSQGTIYAAAFYLGSHFWLVALLFGAWLALPSPGDRVRRLKAFSAGAFVLYNAYVLKIGGDFMYGRFYVVLLPLLLLGAEDLVHALAARAAGAPARRAVSAFLAAELLLATAHGVPLIQDGDIRWRISDETSRYRVVSVRPIAVLTGLFASGRFLKRVVVERGIAPTIAATAIGMVGYYSDLPVVDLHGLTDPLVARTPLAARGRPGHEKWAPDGYLLARGVRLVMGNYHPEPYAALAEIHFRMKPRLGIAWQLFVYDRALMREIRARCPEIEFVDFEAFLDNYLRRLPARPLEDVRRDLAWFRRFYFDANDDPARLKALTDFLAARGGP